MSRLPLDEHKIRFRRACDALDARVRDHVGSPCLVRYDPQERDEDWMPIDDLDEIPISGYVRFVADLSAYGGDSQDYQSPVVLQSPTWLDICEVANDMLRAIGYGDLVTVEWAHVYDDEGDVQIARIFLR